MNFFCFVKLVLLSAGVFLWVCGEASADDGLIDTNDWVNVHISHQTGADCLLLSQKMIHGDGSALPHPS